MSRSQIRKQYQNKSIYEISRSRITEILMFAILQIILTKLGMTKSDYIKNFRNRLYLCFYFMSFA